MHLRQHQNYGVCTYLHEQIRSMTVLYYAHAVCILGSEEVRVADLKNKLVSDDMPSLRQ